MSETTGRIATGMPREAIATVQESYSFACMRCGHGWEQSYDIEHFVDGTGNEFVMYVVDGRRVPSPLTRPTCMNCGGHVVRIMRPGRVSSVQKIASGQPFEYAGQSAAETQGAESEGESGESEADAARKSGHHWHLSDLLHPFRHQHRNDG
ncbi:hypothetical protein QIS99_10365 [Streptomyces sp. B-S-A8]|uniref:Uncharacterized protein n=1 Tax=Streptomyces solicavernae TaxID=3043614 RepID=A0ABT6RQ95_9ACTN|nr:hypothetical protein [Streptomyces sp. B-S-A8]MDI3386611.1 hypothetical protein [Streptomyces sp. B-S-A8]